ncbi:hypothetical protein GNI_012150 [Gregarina niphandrodes]|uniref:Uncharacterized protein n=1 Tax=Gregarina niphandrodes TaxID=110365 RepID=A0A023BCZ0_GRENI|nr:hypothetical protein GNI_012150 [Gregarina niphandrodes]EZG85055.1 hypothetical protein GNI_012150 [Gregarina niphandrodes]|eukprot:XP_011128848.1 hypothetical protein GNI_012150 [Gregarina niphandrodes]
MRKCYGGHEFRWITVAVFGVPNVGGTLHKDAGYSRARAPLMSSTLPPIARTSGFAGVAEVEALDVPYHSNSVLTEPLPVSALDMWPDAWKEDSREWSMEGSRKPLVEANLEEPLMGSALSCLAMESSWKLLAETPPEPSVAVSSVEQMTEAWPELLVETWPKYLREAPLEPLIEVLLKPLMETSPLMETWPLMETSPLIEASVEPLVEASRRPLLERLRAETWPEPSITGSVEPSARVSAETSVAETVSGHNLVARVLEECLEKEKDNEPVLSPDEELRVVRLAKAAVMRELSKPSSGTGVWISKLSISDFEACSWRWLKLVLLMHAWQDKGGGFGEVISVLESFLPRPVGVNDTWFLAGVVQRFTVAGYLSRWLPRTVPVGSGWHSRTLLYRVTFPDDVVRLPETEECVNRVCASSKLGWWLCEAQRNIRIDEETWKVPVCPNAIFTVQRALGKQIFDDALQAMRRMFTPPSRMSNAMFVACLLKHVDTMSLTKNIRRLRLTSSSSTSSSFSQPSPCSSDIICHDSVRPDGLIDSDRSVDAEMTSFLARVIEDCATRERNEAVSLTGVWCVARTAFEEFEAVLSSKRKSDERRRDGRTMPLFNSCGWRWLCLAGLMNDHLEPDEVRQLIAESEKLVPRPKHVSPLWYLACRIQACLRVRVIAAGFKSWLKAPPAWWVFSCAIYQDHFPKTFGQLPMSKRSARLIAFTSKAAHWIASGIKNFHVTKKTLLPSSYGDIVDIFHKVMGDRWFNEMINIIRPKISIQARQHMGQMTDKSLMEIILKYARAQRNMASQFCGLWQFDIASKRSDDLADAESSEDERPTKRVCNR